MDAQASIFSSLSDVGAARLLLADLHDDLAGKVGRFRQLADLSNSLGSHGTMIAGGEVAYSAWIEARSSFVHGNFVATVMLCQGLAEHMLAAHLSMALGGKPLPPRIKFHETLSRCLEAGVVNAALGDDLRRLMELRNPLSHYRGLDDESNLSRRVIDSRRPAEDHLLADATFAISVAVNLLAARAFRVDSGSLID